MTTHLLSRRVRAFVETNRHGHLEPHEWQELITHTVMAMGLQSIENRIDDAAEAAHTTLDNHFHNLTEQ